MSPSARPPFRALPGWAVDALRTGDASGHNGDRSRARMALTMVYVSCGRSRADLLEDIARPESLASDWWIRRKRTNKVTGATSFPPRSGWERLLSREWAKCERHYQPAALLPENAVEASRYLDEMVLAIDATTFGARTDTTDRAILHCLVRKARELGRINLTMAFSQIEIGARLGRCAVRSGLRRLVRSGWLASTTSSTATRSAGYRLSIPSDRPRSETLDQLDVDHADSDLLEVLSPGIRKTYAVLSSMPLSVRDLAAQPSTPGRGQVHRHLAELALRGLARRVSGGYVRDTRGIRAALAEGSDLARVRRERVKRRQEVWALVRGVRHLGDDWSPSAVVRAANRVRQARVRAAQVRQVRAANAAASERAHRQRMAVLV